MRMKSFQFWNKGNTQSSENPPDYWDEISPETSKESTMKRDKRNFSSLFKYPAFNKVLKYRTFSPFKKTEMFEIGRPTPFVELRGRISQVWTNQWVIILILMIIKLFMFKSNLENSISNAELYAEKTADNANELMEKTALVPQYMARTANTLIVKTIDHTIESLAKDLILIITGLEEIIFFMLELLVGTYACLSMVLIDATANAAINATEKVISFANTTAIAAEKVINKSVEKLDDAFNDLRNLVSMVDTFFSDGHNEIQEVGSTVNHAFATWSIPSSINTELENLRSHIPTYDDVKNNTRKLIELPFKELKKELNASLHSDNFGIDHNLLPIPQASTRKKNSLITPQQIQDIYHEFYRIINIAVIVIIVLFVIAIWAFIFWEAYREISHWRWMETCAIDTSQIGLSEETRRDKRLHNIIRAESHMKYKIYDFIVGKFYPGDQLKRTLLLWNIEYMTTPTTLTLLGLAIGGFLLVGIQFVIIRLVQNAIPRLEENLSHLAHDLTLDFKQEAQYWSNSTNFAIDKAQSNVNDNMLKWIRTGSTAVNGTLNGFMDHMNSALNTAFGKTPLNDFVSGVIGCVFGNKVRQLQKALTWANDHARVEFPRIESSLIDPSAQLDNSTRPTYFQDTKHDVVSFMHHTIEYYKKSLFWELWVAVALFVVWLLFLIFSLLYCQQAYTKHKNDTSSIENLDDLINPDPPPKTDYFTRNGSRNLALLDLQMPKKPLFHQRSFSDTAASPVPPSIGRDWQYDPDNPPDFLLSDPFKSIYSEGVGSSHHSTFQDRGPPTPVILRPRKAKMVSIRTPSFCRQSYNGDIGSARATWKRY